MKYHHRILFINGDITTLTADTLLEKIQQHWPTASWDKFVHIHASPSCRSHSRADRGLSRHRGSAGEPLSKLAVADDAACESAVQIMEHVLQHAPNAMYTIENPVSWTFELQPCIKRLLATTGWQSMVTCYCKCADPLLDDGAWPRKDTIIIAHGLPARTSLPICDHDCQHLIERREVGKKPRHKVVICSSRSNWPEQVVLKDPMIKGRIPHGLFQILEEKHAQWASTPAAEAHFTACMASHPDELASAVAHAFAAHMDRVCVDSETGQAYATEDDVVSESDELVHENDFDKDGIRRSDDAMVRQDVPEHKVRDVPVNELYRFLPEHWRKHGMLDTFQPWSIVFVDNITVSHGKGAADTKLLLAYDVATSGMRVKPYKHKHELGELMDELIVEEALDKRKHRVTVGADGDGAMVLAKEACRRRNVSWLPIPPWQPHLNPVELAVSHLKASMASVMMAACTEDGPLTTAYGHYAARYVAYVNERFAALRRGETYRGDHHKFQSPWRLNVGVNPRLDRLVPWGQPGYAFIPEELRKSRGAPKYLRAEPVLLIGYQFMYTNVYKVLTRHGTTIDTEQVTWCMDAPRGIFPPVGGEKRVRNAYGRLSLDEILPGFEPHSTKGDQTLESKQAESSTDQAKATPTGALSRPSDGKDSSTPGARAVLRINVEKVTTGTGPAPHILARCEELDGTLFNEATGKRFINHKGELKPYRKQDLDYDLKCGWLRVDIETSNGKVLVVNDHGSDFSYGRWGHHGFASLVAAQGKYFTSLGKVSNELNAAAFIAMRDMKWSKYLHGPDHEAIMAAYNKEWDSLTSSVLRELSEDDPEYEDAVRYATKGRIILEFKRVGIWKARVVVRGDLEDRERLDGPDFNYAANVCEFAAVRNLLFQPRENPAKSGRNGDPTVIASADIAVAYTQADRFQPHEPKRYLMVLDPVTGKWRYFRQLGNLYGSAGAGVRWEKTLVKFMTDKDSGFVQGKNEPCAFYNAERDIAVLSYCDDLLVRGKRSQVQWFFNKLGRRFNIKPPAYLSSSDMLDHLGMVIFESDEGLYLSMQSYIEVVCHKLNIDIKKCEAKPGRLPMSGPITNMEPCSKEEAKLFMTACGMCGWVSATGRPEIRVYHSRVSQYMASPVKGALDAVMSIIKYLAATRTLCLFQPWGTDSEKFGWRCYSDSDQSSNPELINKRRSQLSFIATRGEAPVAFGSKCSSVKMPSDLDCFGPSYFGLDKPTCHPMMTDIHADVSSAAAEVYAASVATNEMLHLSYISGELGISFPTPIPLEVDNQTAIHFSKGTTQRSKMKHIDARQAWVEALRDDKIVKLRWVPTKLNLADLNSKFLPTARFQALRDRILHAKALPTLETVEVAAA